MVKIGGIAKDVITVKIAGYILWRY